MSFEGVMIDLSARAAAKLDTRKNRHFDASVGVMAA